MCNYIATSLQASYVKSVKYGLFFLPIQTGFFSSKEKKQGICAARMKWNFFGFSPFFSWFWATWASNIPKQPETTSPTINGDPVIGVLGRYSCPCCLFPGVANDTRTYAAQIKYSGSGLHESFDVKKSDWNDQKVVIITTQNNTLLVYVSTSQIATLTSATCARSAPLSALLFQAPKSII